MPLKLLCWLLFAVSIVGCGSLPEKNVTPTGPAATLALPTKTPGLTAPPATAPLTTATPALASTPAHAPCPPFSIDTELPVPDEPQNYIGLHFDALPAGLKSPDGAVLDGPGTYYMVNEVVRDSGEMLWLERNVCHDESGHPYQEIRAVLVLPALKEREKTLIGTCRLKEAAAPEVAPKLEFDPAIVAVGRFEDIYKPPVTISHAWRVITQTESFEALPPESVTCTGLQGL